ncbi:MAG TPA: DUF2550 domain-containing protein [Nocardioidaceae bacterium]|nr:DUF2550 domain-containing protein [Nocardioidaceae bacterium]
MDVLALVDVLIGLVVLAGLILVGLASRRRWLAHGGGTFECGLRLPTSRRQDLVGISRGWTLGVARYSGDQIDWYRVFSPSPRPRHTWARRDVMVRSRRAATGAETLALPVGAVVVECAILGRTVQLGMGPGELTGFLAWLEAAPPGQNVSVA